MRDRVTQRSISVGDELKSYLGSARVKSETYNAVLALRDAADFAISTAVELAIANEVITPQSRGDYTWTIWCLLKYTRMLPPTTQVALRETVGPLVALPPKANVATPTLNSAEDLVLVTLPLTIQNATSSALAPR